MLSVAPLLVRLVTVIRYHERFVHTNMDPAYNAAMDVFCAIVPYFLIRQLNIPRKDKRNLIILMGGSIV
jgi:hypothetical protein